jgi:PAS domain-containing protein
MPRYRFVLVEDPETTLPVRYQPPRHRVYPPVVVRSEPMELLLEALWRLSLRGEGESAWAPSLSENPLEFLLDAIGDAVVLRREGGATVYANPAARRLAIPEPEPFRDPQGVETVELEGGRFERRRMAFRSGNAELTLEVLRRLG